MATARDARPRMLRRYWVDAHIDITGAVVMGTTFDGCIVHLNREPLGSFLKGCLFVDCRLTGNGWNNPELRRLNRINEPWERNSA